ncbi:MAG TPA: hypothetical protein VGQ59_03085 [Cyclobacteriaceae bacterium]|jgi:hypothetical protein|nr:hypothetical protein [Cyclobacteriaceae bacterium]
MRKIGAGLLTIGTFILFLGFQVENYNLYFFIAGGLMVLIGTVSVAFLDKKVEKEADDNYQAWKEKLMREGVKTEVDLNKVEIRSNNDREEIINEENYGVDRYRALDDLVGRDSREFSDIKQSVILYEAEILGTKRKFYSPVIPKDEITLQFLLSNQKITFIYFDRLNENNYFFDLEFLND